MSAIFGWLSLADRSVPRAALARMQSTLAPYGPARQRHIITGSVGLGSCLAEVTPDDVFDDQPLMSKDGRVRMVADVRIYNRAALGRELGVPAGDQVPDSLLLLEAWLRWGRSAAAHIEGDYACAVWDSRDRALHLMRDPFGQRPLFWHAGRDFLAFASLPKALFAVPEIPRTLNRGRVFDALTLLPHWNDESFFSGVQRVRPGHCFSYDARGTSSTAIRQLDAAERIVLRDDDEYVEAFTEHLHRAVRERLRARGGVASHLSGGYDSSTVTVVAARELASSGARLVALTAAPRPGFSGPVRRGRVGDESGRAAAVASLHPNIDHVVVRSGAETPTDPMQQFCDATDRPLIAVGNLNWWTRLDLEARDRGASVLLTGASGNMTISHHGLTRLPRLLLEGKWLDWIRELTASGGNVSRRRVVATSLSALMPVSLWHLASPYLRGRRFDIFRYGSQSRALAEHFGDRVERSGWDTSYRPWRDGRAMRIAVFARSDPGDVNQASRLNGIELRDPCADFRLARFCLAIPEEQFLRRRHSHRLLRRAMRERLPAEVLRQDGGRGEQAADWFEGATRARPAMRRQIEQLRQIPAARDILDLDRLAALIEEWPETGWDDPDIVQRYRSLLLRGVAMGAFIQYVEGSNRVSRPLHDSVKTV